MLPDADLSDWLSWPADVLLNVGGWIASWFFDKNAIGFPLEEMMFATLVLAAIIALIVYWDAVIGYWEAQSRHPTSRHPPSGTPRETASPPRRRPVQRPAIKNAPADILCAIDQGHVGAAGDESGSPFEAACTTRRQQSDKRDPAAELARPPVGPMAEPLEAYTRCRGALSRDFSGQDVGRAAAQTS
jgi:hypothetical protein